MKKLNFTFLFFLTLLTSSFSQSYRLEFGEEYKESSFGAYVNQEILGVTQHYYYVFNPNKQKRGLSQYSFQHKLKNIIPIDLEYGKEEMVPQAIIRTRTGVYMLTSTHDRMLDMVHKHAFRLDEKTGKLGEPQRLFSHPFSENMFFTSTGDENQDVTGVSISSDSSAVLFTFVYALKDRGKKTDEYGLFVADEKLEKMWERKVSFPFKDQKFKVRQFSVNNKGEAFLLTQNQTLEKRRPYLPRKDFRLYKISGKRDVQYVEIKKGAQVVFSPAISQIGEAGFGVLGLCADGGAEKSELNYGVFMAGYDDDLRPVFFSVEPLGEKECLWGTNSPLSARPQSYEDYRARGTIINYNTRTLAYIAECVTGAGKSTKSEQLLIVSFALDGSFRWRFCHQKKFEASEPANSSVVVGYKDSDIYLLYNDEKSINERMESDHQGKMLAQFTDIACINGEGELIEEKTIFTSRENGSLYFEPLQSVSVRNGLMLLYMSNNKKVRLATLYLGE
jgi:hypothetical protein